MDRGALGDLQIASTVISPTFCGMTPALGSNLVVNGGAELNPGAADAASTGRVACWDVTGSFGGVAYGATGFPPAFSESGINFFAGGPGSESSTAIQTIEVSNLASAIDAGTVSAALNARLGGKGTQPDNMTVSVTFKSAASGVLGSTLTIGPATPGQRSNTTQLLAASATTPVPPQTRFIVVTMTATRAADTYNDGYADSISLILN